MNEPKQPQPTIGVDFDGTVCDFAYPGIGSPKAGVKEALEMFRKLGYRIVIWTCRTCHYHYDIFGGDPAQHTLERPFVKEMIAYLDEHQIPYDEVDDGSRGKLHADFYIDDKGIRFDESLGFDWKYAAQFVLTRTPADRVLAAVDAAQKEKST